MHEEIKAKRASHKEGALRAACMHLTNAASALQSANLYTSPGEEQTIDEIDSDMRKLPWRIEQLRTTRGIDED